MIGRGDIRYKIQDTYVYRGGSRWSKFIIVPMSMHHSNKLFVQNKMIKFVVLFFLASWEHHVLLIDINTEMVCWVSKAGNKKNELLERHSSRFFRWTQGDFRFQRLKGKLQFVVRNFQESYGLFLNFRYNTT